VSCDLVDCVIWEINERNALETVMGDTDDFILPDLNPAWGWTAAGLYVVGVVFLVAVRVFG